MHLSDLTWQASNFRVDRCLTKKVRQTLCDGPEDDEESAADDLVLRGGGHLHHQRQRNRAAQPSPKHPAAHPTSPRSVTRQSKGRVKARRTQKHCGWRNGIAGTDMTCVAQSSLPIMSIVPRPTIQFTNPPEQPNPESGPSGNDLMTSNYPRVRAIWQRLDDSKLCAPIEKTERPREVTTSTSESTEKVIASDTKVGMDMQ